MQMLLVRQLLPDLRLLNKNHQWSLCQLLPARPICTHSISSIWHLEPPLPIQPMESPVSISSSVTSAFYSQAAHHEQSWKFHLTILSVPIFCRPTWKVQSQQQANPGYHLTLSLILWFPRAVWKNWSIGNNSNCVEKFFQMYQHNFSPLPLAHHYKPWIQTITTPIPECIPVRHQPS